jgi:ribosomal protein L16 Arg81 hydroxylase
MNQGYQELARLLQPIEPEAFFRDTWEKRPLGIYRNDPAYYRDLFTLRDVDQVIAFTRPRVFHPEDLESGPAPSRSVVQGWQPDEEPALAAQYPDVSALHRAFAAGKTISLRAMDLRWPAIASLCRRLQGLFGCHVHGNLYLTPKGAQGFSPHFDTHEVFVLQLEGTKHWRFYGPACDLPLAEDDVPVDRKLLGPPTEEAVLRSGDLLYMPRGHVHEAFTSDCLSLHLTVGVRVFRWVDLLGQALADVTAGDVRFRQALPPGLLTARSGEVVRQRFRELLHALAEHAEADEAVDHLAETFLPQMPALPGDFFAAADADTVGLDSELQRAPGAVCRVVRAPDGRVALVYPGNRVDGPARIAPLLDHIARTPRFVVRDLPGELTPDSKLVLARRLVRERFLTLADRPAVGSEAR